ncbi:MAG: METTL5 family protein [Candidatus Ranarchaeia archaeon]
MMSILRRKKLERVLQQVPGFLRPRLELEQYPTPPGTAATLLHVIAYTFSDILGKKVVDLGCGTGRLAIGAALLGADQVIGIDIDPTALRTAVYASSYLVKNRTIEWILSDVKAISFTTSIHTVIQNPPFGVQTRHSDQIFIKKAMAIGHVVYTLHAAGDSAVRYIQRLAEENGGFLDQVITLPMMVKRQFSFHRKKCYTFKVHLYRIVRRS